MQRVVLTSIMLAMLFALVSPSVHPAGDKEGGIIGTGLRATGIVGTITALGSIYVNGQHILFDDTQTVESPLGDRRASSLVQGETVVVEAVAAGDAWHAESIRAYLPIIGPVDAVAERSLSVIGVNIAIPDDVQSVALLAGTNLEEDDWVAVSGFWSGDTIVASRIEKVAPLPFASVVGSYRPSAGMQRVGAVRMLGVDLQHAKPLEVLTVQGVPTPEGLEVDSVAIGLFSGPVGEVFFEGYLSQPDIRGAYTVQGSGLLAYVGDPGMEIDPSRGLFCGETQRPASIARVLQLPEAVSSRKSALRALNSGPSLPCGPE